ncbi:amino acid permease domain-containing protein [Ditylenchus destructor]|uniref:Amino acid permease domain-containing protein n=1 Tax=Ditylenchus destructor TaxID=166010 RepID=A0AAD4R0Y8_9BILA|nr:amino acid permease domain-containing protein [Ditylenchus destructor]
MTKVAQDGVAPEVETVSPKNKMGLLGGISYIVGNIVGAGIFITPTAILTNTNSVGLSLFIWIFTGVIAALGSFSYIELGTAIHESGCDFAYACYVKWYALAFCYMCVGCLVHYPAVVAIQAQTFSEYLFVGLNLAGCDTAPNGLFSTYAARKLLEVALISILVYLNFFSLRKFVSRFNILATTAKIMATASIIIIGLYFLIAKGRVQNFNEPFKNSTFSSSNLVSALFAGLFSYDGWDILNFGTEEIVSPRRTLPLSIIIGMSIVCSIYVLINVAYFTVLDVPSFLSTNAVASTFVKVTIGEYSFLMPIMVCILIVGSLNGTIFVSSRFLHAAARGGFLPTFISCTNPETDSPRAALVIHLVLVFTMTFTADLHALINYIGFAQWSQRGITMVVLFWIRYKHASRQNANVIRAPLIVPILFFLICSGLTVVTVVEDTKSALLCVIVLLVTYVIYIIFIYDKALPSQKWYRGYAEKADSAFTSIFQVMLDTMPQKLQMINEPEIDQQNASPKPIENSKATDSINGKRSDKRRRVGAAQKVGPITS